MATLGKLRRSGPALTRPTGLAPMRVIDPRKPTLAFYGSGAWKALMRDIIAERGRQCEDPRCQTPGRGRGQRVYGDHITELRDGGPALDRRNIMLRCAKCHGRKTAEEARIRKQFQ